MSMASASQLYPTELSEKPRKYSIYMNPSQSYWARSTEAVFSLRCDSRGCYHADVRFNIGSREVTLDVVLNGDGVSKAKKKVARQIHTIYGREIEIEMEKSRSAPQRRNPAPHANW